MLLALALVPGSELRGQHAYEELRTFSTVLNHIQLNYVDSIGYDVLVEAAIRGVLAELDPHSRYVAREENRRLAALARGELGSAGVELEEVDGAVTVLSVARDGPAERAGVAPGDRLLAIDDTTIAGLEPTEVELRLIGPEGSELDLTLARGPRLDPHILVLEVERSIPRQRTVGGATLLDPATAYLRLESFEQTTADDLHDALEKVMDDGAQRAILDLRGNPGGLVTSAVEVAAEFLPEDAVVFRTEGRKGAMDVEYRTDDDGDFRDLPLILLVDEHTASAAEALAGALQDHDRALIIGRRTFGKALVQSIFLLPGGDAVWLTVGRVTTPSGRFIQRPYDGLSRSQYHVLAHTSDAGERAGGVGGTADTAAIYRTDAGRKVRGGGGIAPDIDTPGPPPPPRWWSALLEDAHPEAVADSVAASLPGVQTAAAWVADSVRWEQLLLPPLLSRVRQYLDVEPRLKPATAKWMARLLARRVATVRWGREATEELALRTDPDVAAAQEAFSRLSELLGATPGT